MNQASRKSWLVPVLPAAIQPGISALRAVPDEQRLLHHRVHHRDMARLDHLAELVGLPRIQQLAFIGADLGHDMRGDAEPAIGKRRIGADQFDARETSEVPSAIEGLASSFDEMPSRCAVRTTFFGPTSMPSRTATVLSDIASAWVSVTAPKYSWV